MTVDPTLHDALDMVEAERRRISRALHDELGQDLCALRHVIEQAQVERGPARQRSLADGMALVDRLIDRVRDFAHDVRPTVLDDIGLAAALRALIERKLGRAGIASALALDDTLPTPPRIASACYRIAQEALSNVVRHAAAHLVRVTLHDNRGLELAITDDGRGFDPAGVQGKSLGLTGMRERATLAGGSLEIESGGGRGTTVRARFPRTEPT